MNKLRDYIPVYVTRPYGVKGVTGQVSLRQGTLLAIKFVVVSNALGWGVYGLVQLAGKAI